MGLVNQFAGFAPDLKHAMVPLQGLLRPKNAYVWTQEHEDAMAKVKEAQRSSSIKEAVK